MDCTTLVRFRLVVRVPTTEVLYSRGRNAITVRQFSSVFSRIGISWCGCSSFECGFFQVRFDQPFWVGRGKRRVEFLSDMELDGCGCGSNVGDCDIDCENVVTMWVYCRESVPADIDSFPRED